MSKGQVFRQSDLDPKVEPGVAGSSGMDDDVLGKINQFVTNVDNLLTHFVDIKEKHPEIMGKLGNLTGQNRLGPGQFAGGQARSNPGQFSPSNQPGGNQALNSTSKNIDPEKVYTMLLGLLHTFEGQHLTVEAIKKLIIANKPGVISELKKALPSLLED